MKFNKIKNYIFQSNINFCKHSKYYLAIISALLLSAIIIISIIGMKLGFDFKGGTVIEVVYGIEFDENGDEYIEGTPYDLSLSKNYIDKFLDSENAFEIVSIQTAESEYGNKVIYKLISNDKPSTDKLTQMKNNLYNIFDKYNESGLLQSKYISVFNVDGTKDNVASYSAIAISVGIVLISILAFFRFGISSALTLFISLLINTLLTFASVIICRITVDVAFIASVFTVFILTLISNLMTLDKIRNNLKNKDLQRTDIANLSVKQSLIDQVIIMGFSLISIILLTGFGVLSIRNYGLPVVIGLIFIFLSNLYLIPFLWSKIKFKKLKYNN